MTASVGAAEGTAWNLYSNDTLVGDVPVTTAGVVDGAGKAGGTLRTGQHLQFSAQPSVGNLFVTLAQALGVSQTSFGDSTGPLAGIRV